MSRPSDQVLALLRKIMADRKVNTASLAASVNIPRARMRKLLAGTEPMLVDELLPKFFHPDLVVLTGRSVWHVRFVVDGTVERTLRLDDMGVHDVSHEPDIWPEIEIETDILTLLAMLRAEIARFHMTKPPYPAVPRRTDGEDAVDDDVSGW